MDQAELKRLVRDTYPFPIAHAYKKVLGCLDENEQKLKCIVETTEIILQFLALISLSQVQHDLSQNQHPPGLAAVKDKIKNVLFGETSPEQWRQITLEIIKIYSQLEDQLVVPELINLCFLPNHSDTITPSRIQTESINPLLRTRQQFYQNAIPASTMKEQLVASLNQLNELIDSCGFLSHYQLTFVRQITVDSDRGQNIRYNHDLLHISGCYSNFDSSRWQSDFNLKSGGIVLLNRKKRRFLNLNPFLIFADQIPVPGVNDVYLLTSVTRNQIGYRSSQFSKLLSSEDKNWAEGPSQREILSEFLDKLRLTNSTETGPEIIWREQDEPGETLSTHSTQQSAQSRHQRSAEKKQPLNPYKFLDYYNPEDKDIFFGRDREIEIMQQRFYSSRVMVLHGESGSGKTSLIRAGLIPALSPETYTIIYVRTLKSPANEIKQELIEQLGRDDRHLNLDLLDFLTRETEYISKTVVIVLDQFEEFFIRFPQSVRQVFEKELSDCFQVPHLDIKVIISMRSDYFSFLAEFEHFYPEIFNRQFHLHPLTEEQGLEAIIKPLQLLEVEVDESMVRTSLLPGLISDGKIEPPLLQIVCDALYGNLKSRGGNEVDILDLEAVGNVHGAINQYLEKCLRQFGPYQQAAKSVLKSMVTSQDTRHAAFLDELTSRVQTSGLNIASEELDKKYLAKFIRQRLVRIETIGGKASFELSHEVLVQQISDWIDENERELKETLQLIDQSFETHQLKGLLLSKKNIKTISPLRSQIHLASEKEIFLKKSSNRWRRKKLTNWSLTVSSLLLFVLFIVLVAYELPQPSAIDDAKREKDWGVVLQVYLEVLEGRDDWRIPYDIKITGTLENMFSSSDKGKAEEISIESPPIIVEKDNFDNNQGVVTPEVSEKIKKVELIIPELSGLPYKWEKIEKRKILRDIETATEWFTPVIGVFTWEKPLLKAKFSPDGKMIAAGSEDKSVIIWDTDSGKRVAHLTGHTSNIIDLVFNPNQSHLATAGADGTILIWDLRTYKQEHKLKGSQLSITSIDYSPNGHVLASGSADSSIQLWDTLTHQPLKLLKGHKKSINALRFHPAKNFLVSASNDLSIRWWNIETGRVMRIFWGHKAAVIALDFDTKFNLISSGLDNIRLWRLNSTHKQVIAQGSKAIRINRGNNSLVFVNRDNALKFLYSVDHDFPDHYFGISRCCENRNQITAMDFNPSGSMMISTSGRRIYLWLIAKSLKPLKNQLISTEKPTDWETRETQIKKILSLGTAYEKLYLSENEDPPGYYVSWEKSPEELHKAWLKAAQNAEIPWFEDGGRSRVDFYRNALQYEKGN